MTKVKAGVISKLMKKGNAEPKQKSEDDASSSDDELVENTIFETLSDKDDDENDNDAEDDAKSKEESDLEDVKSEDDEEDVEEDEDDDVDEEDEDNDEEKDENDVEENAGGEKTKNNKRKAEDKKERNKSKKAKKDSEEGEEGEEEEEENDDNNKNEKKVRERTPDSLDKLARTLFVGNIPHDFDKKAFKALLITFGPLISFRIRSIAPSKESLSKKVAFLSGKVNSNKATVNVYAVYKSTESVTKALALNGHEFEKHILRADRVTPNKVYQNTKSTVFVGNLPTKTTDNQLHHFFSSCGKINSVRIIRDKRTCAGKGIGYVEFESKEAAQAALEMNGQTFQNRDIRVQEYHYKQQKPNTTPFQGIQGQKKFVGKRKNNVLDKNNNSGKKFNGKKSSKIKSQHKSKGKIIKAKNQLAKKKNLAKILTKQ